MPPSPATLFLRLSCSLILGLASGPYYQDTQRLWMAFMIGVVWVFSFKKHKLWFWHSMCVLFVVVGMLRYQYAAPPRLPFANQAPVVLEGMVSAYPDVRPTQQRLTITLSAQINGTTKKKLDGLILVSTTNYPLYQYGDVLKISGKIEPLTQNKDPTMEAYNRYLKSQGISATFYQPRLEYLKSEGKWRPQYYIFILKKYFEETLFTLYPEPAASFLNGLLLGSRAGLPASLTAELKTVGLTHIMAISGYNITILIMAVAGLCAFLQRKKQFVVTLLFIIFFAILTGQGATVVRAGIMGVIGLVAFNLRRPHNISYILIFSALIMLMFNPLLFADNLSFQLSFMATAGLVFVQPLLKDSWSGFPDFFSLKETLFTTAAAQVTTFPLLAYYFKQFSWITPLANLLILPLIPILMLLGFGSVIVFPLSKTVAMLIGSFNNVLMTMAFLIIHLIAQVPSAAISTNWFNLKFFLGYYGCLGLILGTSTGFFRRI